MQRSLIILSLFTALTVTAAAQDYNTGIGFRGGPFNGVTVKHFIKQNGAVEVLLASRWKGFEATGLYEIHHNFGNVDRLKFYFGAGGHLGAYNGKHTGWSDKEGTYPVLGVDLILGVEYSFREVPLNLGFDWKPAYNILGSGFVADGAAFSIRFIF
jgi:hypothetical protein